VVELGTLAAPLLAVAALAAVPAAGRGWPPGGPGRGAGRGRRSVGWLEPVVVLDALVALCALVLVSWVAAPMVPAPAAALAHLAVDLIVIFAVILLTARRPTRDRLIAVLLAGGLLSIAVADGMAGRSVGAYGDGDGLADPAARIAQLAGAGWCALAAWHVGCRRQGAPEDRRDALARSAADRSWPVRAVAPYLPYLPYLPPAAAAGLLLGQSAGGSRADAVRTAAAVALAGLLLTRLFFTARANEELLRRVSAADRHLRYQALHDSLTSLASRPLFVDRLGAALVAARRDGREVAAVLCDLDDFKLVNDGLGRAAGDQVLRVVAGRIRHCAAMRSTTVARLGGDEFAVLVPGGLDRAEVVAGQLLGALRAPVPVVGHARRLRASVGIAVAEPGQETAESLVRRAEAAVLMARRTGRGGIAVHRPGMSLPDTTLHLADALVTARRHGWAAAGFDVHYQPIVRLRDGAVVAVEALARWTEPGRGPIPPITFVAAAEDGGLVAALDEFVLTRACAEVALAWPTGGGRGFGPVPRLHVNVSASRLSDPDLPETLAAALHAGRLEPARLVVEITETSRITDLAAAAAVLDQVHRLGAWVALDDVGAGHTNLAALHQLPVDVVKLDRGLIENPLGSSRAARLGRSVITVARSLGAVVIAEGIERRSQLSDLALLGCEQGQGYLFARPGPLVGLGYPATSRPVALPLRSFAAAPAGPPVPAGPAAPSVLPGSAGPPGPAGAAGSAGPGGQVPGSRP
jgi:diguanylate cyclase (GGDEF)-like protein